MLLLGWAKGLRHYQLIALLGWPLPPRGNSASPVFQGLAVLSLWDSLRSSTHESIRWCPCRNSIQRTRNFWCTYKSTCPTAHRWKSFWEQFLKNKVPTLLSNPPLSSFKKLIVLTPRLVQGLRTMSLAKVVPKGINDKECKRFALQERPPVPYAPEKDPVQETVLLLKSDQSLKTTIGADAELCLPIWHCRKREAFLMHVSSTLNAIKKRAPSRPTRKPTRLI